VPSIFARLIEAVGHRLRQELRIRSLDLLALAFGDHHRRDSRAQMTSSLTATRLSILHRDGVHRQEFTLAGIRAADIRTKYASSCRISSPSLLMRSQSRLPRGSRWSNVDHRTCEVKLAYTRQWLVDLLRRIGYTEAADEALREMPEEFDLKQLQEFGERHGLSREEVTDAMGGSP
jgi:hypothetical protein